MMAPSLREDPFAAPLAKRQEKRRQRVIDTGVYGIILHPMLAGGALLLVGIPLYWLICPCGRGPTPPPRWRAFPAGLCFYASAFSGRKRQGARSLAARNLPGAKPRRSRSGWIACLIVAPRNH